MKQQTFNGVVYKKYKGENYFSKGNKRLHRVVWEYYNGAIPDGYEIHHIDKNSDNNNIENLMCLSREEHKNIHKEKDLETLKKMKKNLDDVRHLAKEWHSSEEGAEWHKQHYYNSLGKVEEKEFVCECCGNVFKTKPFGVVKYCSNKCKAKARRDSGVDNIECECLICKEKFVKDKYSKKTTCSRTCGAKLGHLNKKGKDA